MKIAISAHEPSLDALIDERFGRCPYFVIVEPDTMSVEGVTNLTATLGSGSGIQAARLLAEKGVTAVLTGSCGPNAWDALNAANIRVIAGCTGPVREAIKQYNSGEFHPAEGPNVRGHAGERRSSPKEGVVSQGMGRGMGRRGGGGRGRRVGISRS